MIQRPIAMFATLLLLSAGAALCDPLSDLYAKIDSAAKGFKGISATTAITQHTAVVNDDDHQTGALKLLKVPGGTRALMEVKGGMSGTETVAINSQDARVYNPRTRILTIYPLGNKQAVVNQALLLGFGASSAELQASYDVTFVAQEPQGTHVTLVPKSKETQRNLKQADLWYGQNGLVTQQKLLYPSGDYRLVTYSNLKMGAVPSGELDLNPKGATIQRQEQ